MLYFKKNISSRYCISSIFRTCLIFTIAFSTCTIKPTVSLLPQLTASSLEATAYLMGIGATVVTTMLSQTPVHYLSETTKKLLAEDPAEVSLRSIISREERTVSKGVKSSLSKGLQRFFDWFVKNAHVTTSDAERKILLSSFSSGISAAFVYDFLTSSYKYLIKLDTPQARNRIKELSADSAELGKSILASFFAVYPEFRNDLAYPVRFSHGTSLYCGKQDPYCLRAAGPEQKPTDIDTFLLNLHVNADKIAHAFMNSFLFWQADPVVAGYVFGMVSMDVASQLAPLMAETMINPKTYTLAAPLIEAFINKWLSAEVFESLTTWYKDATQEATGEPILNEKELDKKLKLGSFAKFVEAGAGQAQVNAIKSILSKLTT